MVDFAGVESGACHGPFANRMRKRHCTCGAEADVRRGTRRSADGRDEIAYRITCPVRVQLGPALALEGRDEVTAIAEAVAPWNEMIARRRRLEA